MTLADLTALLSRVSREQPELIKDRNVSLFVEACIDEGRKLPVGAPSQAAAVDFSEG